MIARKGCLVLALLLVISSSAQKKPVKPKAHKSYAIVEASPPPQVYIYVEQQPEFPGGTQALDKYLNDHLRYPENAREAGIEGKVMVRFMVDETGSINHVKALKGIGGGCDNEAVSVVKAMPNWHPGKINGKPVCSVYVLPVIFQLR